MRTTTTSNAETRVDEDRDAPHPSSEERTRQAGGPQDIAHYTCSCGHTFASVVTTGVACPKCGAPQDW